MALLNGKTPVYVDESGFRIESVRPVMWVRGETYSEKMEPVYQDVLSIPDPN